MIDIEIEMEGPNENEPRSDVEVAAPTTPPGAAMRSYMDMVPEVESILKGGKI